MQSIRYVDLDPAEALQVDALARTVARDHESSTAPSLLASAANVAQRLPARLLEELQTFRTNETVSALVLRGLPVNDLEIGPTPLHWRNQPEPQRTAALEVYLVLVGSLLGEIFGWSTLQDGNLIHNVLPMPNQEQEQSGHGTVQLEWHTEDGFHPYRCDYLLLLSLRNQDLVPTTVTSIDDVELDPRHRAVLGERRFLIRPDNEHLNHARALTEGTDVAHPIQLMHEDPELCAVLFGHPDAPYLRIDPAFMTAQLADDEAVAALGALIAALDANLAEVPLSPGALLILDNYRAVHGRCAFRARFDGTDRWLKKVVVTRDLRKSRAQRGAAYKRVLL